MNFFGHLKTINHHKRLVFIHCCKVGLVWQGLTHDLSKYSPAEFFVGVKYYQGDRSPNNAEREDKGYSLAWLHHKGRNKHHMEYWIDYGMGEETNMTGMKMPVKYVVEMFCDRVAASKTYRGHQYVDSDPYDYFKKSQSHYLIHKDTEALLEELLTMLKDQGEEQTFSYIKNVVLKQKSYGKGHEKSGKAMNEQEKP